MEPTKRQSAGPLDAALGEIDGAISAKLYYVALVATLTLPDLCGALMSEDGRSTKERYKNWYNANLAHDFTFMTADHCYSLRCGMIHQGRAKLLGGGFDRVIFVPPMPGVFHNNIMKGALQFDIFIFCNSFTNAVARWWQRERESEVVIKNIPFLLRLRAEGYSGRLTGIPVIY
jgi:hypothetical protein